MKRSRESGFTLMEMLIVVAIIAILVSIAIPSFTDQLEKSREAADLANVRNAYAQVMEDWLLDEEAPEMLVPLTQKKDGFQGFQNLCIGDVPETDSERWVGEPAGGGKCLVYYNAGKNSIILNWFGNKSSYPFIKLPQDSGYSQGGSRDPNGSINNRTDRITTTQYAKLEAGKEYKIIFHLPDELQKLLGDNQKICVGTFLFNGNNNGAKAFKGTDSGWKYSNEKDQIVIDLTKDYINKGGGQDVYFAANFKISQGNKDLNLSPNGKNENYRKLMQEMISHMEVQEVDPKKPA